MSRRRRSANGTPWLHPSPVVAMTNGQCCIHRVGQRTEEGIWRWPKPTRHAKDNESGRSVLVKVDERAGDQKAMWRRRRAVSREAAPSLYFRPCFRREQPLRIV